jgi:hypothetical protein
LRAEESEALTLPMVSLDSRPDPLDEAGVGIENRVDRGGASLADFFNLKALLANTRDAALGGAEEEDTGESDEVATEDNYFVAKAKETLDGFINEKLTALPGNILGEAGGKIVESLQGTLEQVSVGKDVLAMAWKNAAELIEYRRLTTDSPTSHFVVPLVDHQITLDQAATVEIVLGEKTLLTFAFPIQFVLKPSQIEIEMRAGRIERVSVGAAVATGSISIDDRPLLEVPERTLPIGRFNAGIPIA